MLRVGIQGVVSDFMNFRAMARVDNVTPPHDSILVDRLFQYVRKFRPSTLEINDDMVEYAARAMFNRQDAFRGCSWDGQNGTTGAVRKNYRADARAALEAALQFVRHEADGPAQPKDPAKRGWLGLGPEVERTQQDYALTDPVAAPAEVPPLKFGEFWDTMAELLNSGFHLVVFQAGNSVHAAVNGRGQDGATPLWLTTWQEEPAHAGGTKITGVPLYHLSNFSSFRILGTYKHTQEVPF